jgi:hypothetical protein
MAKPTKQKPVEGAQFVRYFGPLLDALRELGGSGTPDEVVERIAGNLKLSDEVQNELLPSGEPRYRNQVAWARFYLVREGLLDSSRRGVWSLTERGRSYTLTHQQAREIFLKWVRILQEQRREKESKAGPPEELPPKRLVRRRTSIEPPSPMFSSSCRLPASSVSANASCAKPDSRRSWSRGAAETAASTGTALFP